MSAAVLAVPGGHPYSLLAKIAAGMLGYAAGGLRHDLLGLRGDARSALAGWISIGWPG